MNTKYLYLEKRQRVKKDTTEYSRRATSIDEQMTKAGLDHDIYHFDEVALAYDNEGIKVTLGESSSILDYTHIIFGGHSLGTKEYEIKKLIIRLTDEWNEKNPLDQIKVQNKRIMDKIPYYSKFDIAELCIDHNLPHLKTYYSTNGDYRTNLGPLSYPVVAKHVDGVNDLVIEDGKEKIKKNVFLIMDENDWDQERLADKDLSKFFIQEYTEIGEDYRIFVTNDGVIGGWRRVSPSDNFITVSKGSEYFYYNEPAEEIVDVCDKARKEWGFDFMALDFIYKDGKPYILEFSLHPGFHAYETKCLDGEPVNIAKAIIDAI